MKKRDHAVTIKQLALGSIQSFQVQAQIQIRRLVARRRERRLGQSQLPRGFRERRGGIGARQHDAHQADVFRSSQRYLQGDANFASVERDAFGDQLSLRIARVVT